MILPLGHDEIELRRMPVTLGLVIVNVVVFVAMIGPMQRSNEAFYDVYYGLTDSLDMSPDEGELRVSAAAVAGLPEGGIRDDLQTYAASPGERTSCERYAEADEPARGPASRRDTGQETRNRERRQAAERAEFDELGQQCDAEIALTEAIGELGIWYHRRPFRRLGYIPASPSITTAFSSMFVHADAMHLIGNLWFLFLAGAIAERRWGSLRYLGVYLVCGFYATICHHAASMGSVLPTIGASGAVSAILGVCLRTSPTLDLKLGYFWLLVFRPFMGTFYAQLWIVVGVWFLLQLVSAMFGDSSGVAVWAHIGGFILGYGSTALAQMVGLDLDD